jgi:hypothetical protein
MKATIVSFLIIFISVFSYDQALNSKLIALELSMPKNQILDGKDLMINVKITSHQKKILQITKEEELGYVLQHSGFIAIQVQMKVGQEYHDIPEAAHIDNYPDVKLDTLYTNHVKRYDIPINMLYHYVKGGYRIKVLARLSELNPVKDIYSDWVYFNCQRAVR